MTDHQNRRHHVTPEMVVTLRGELTQTAAARLWHVSLRTVQRWEAGEIRPSHIAWAGMQAIKGRALRRVPLECRRVSRW